MNFITFQPTFHQILLKSIEILILILIKQRLLVSKLNHVINVLTFNLFHLSFKFKLELSLFFT